MYHTGYGERESVGDLTENLGVLCPTRCPKVPRPTDGVSEKETQPRHFSINNIALLENSAHLACFFHFVA